MAVPTITSLSLVKGSTQGWTYVEITGTNFREPTTVYPPGAPVPVPEPSVSVTFGSEAALEVGWISSTLIYAVTPQISPGVVAVTVKNLDDDGVPIAGETVTAPNAFTFERPNVRVVNQPIHSVVGELVRRLRDQVFGDLDYKAPSVDYRKVGATSAQIRVPNMTLAGPTFVPNMFYTQQGNETLPTGPDTFKIRKRRMRYDLEFQIDAASSSKMELLGMRAALITFFDANTKIRVPRNLEDPAAGYEMYELFPGDEGIRDTSVLSVSSVFTFGTSCVIRAVEIETSGAFTNDSIVYTGSAADTLEFSGVMGIP